MLDRWALPLLTRPLRAAARALERWDVSANQVTVAGFAIGMLALPALAAQRYDVALACIVINRIGDGVDGALARLTAPTDAGGYLDIVLDFVFYAGVVCGFAWANPDANALPAATLLFSFIGTGVSFLGFAIMAEKRGIKRLNYPSKGFYYIGGLTEGTETIAVFVLFCLLPGHFPALAYGFAALYLITTITRVIGGYVTLRAADARI